MIRSFGFGTAFLTIALAGCAAKPPEIVPAEGVVLLEGKPLPKVKVLLYPQAQFDAAPDYIAQGVTDEEGRFQLTCHGKPGACACENIVAVVDEIPEELTLTSAREQYYAYMNSLKNRPVPEKYRTVATSTARVTVSADKKDIKIELQR